jgi:hypothetical protein
VSYQNNLLNVTADDFGDLNAALEDEHTYDSLYNHPGTVFDVIDRLGNPDEKAYWLGEIGGPIVGINIRHDPRGEDNPETVAWATLHIIQHSSVEDYPGRDQQDPHYRYYQVAADHASLPTEDLGFAYDEDELARLAIEQVLQSYLGIYRAVNRGEASSKEEA